MRVSAKVALSVLAFVAGTIAPLSAASATTTVDVTGQEDLYNVNGVVYDGLAPVAVNVTGLSQLTFSVTGNTMLNIGSGNNWNNPDGVGSAPSSSYNSGSAYIAGLSTPNAGFLTGAFEGSTLVAKPAALDFTGPGGTSFTSLSPQLQQAFFIGDGLTGNGTGATQVFNVPTGATTLFLGISDACGYNGSPSCYGDNQGTFSVAINGVSSAVPEPASWALTIVGIGLVGFALRRQGEARGFGKARFA